MCVLGMAEEFRGDGIAFNALWPQTVIDTAAVRNLLGGEEIADQTRTSEILADAAHIILTKNSRECTGRFFVDEDVLRDEGVTDFQPVSDQTWRQAATRFFSVIAVVPGMIALLVNSDSRKTWLIGLGRSRLVSSPGLLILYL